LEKSKHRDNKDHQECSLTWHEARGLIERIILDIIEIPKLGLLNHPKNWQESSLINAQPSNTYIRVVSKQIFDLIDSLDGAFEQINLITGDEGIQPEYYEDDSIDNALIKAGGNKLFHQYIIIQDFLAGHFVRSATLINSNELALDFMTFRFKCYESGVTVLIPDYLREQPIYRAFPFKALKYLMLQHYNRKIVLGWSEINRKRCIEDPIIKKSILAAKELSPDDSGYYKVCEAISQKYATIMENSEGVYDWDRDKKLVSGHTKPQNIAETLEHRFGQNGIKFDSMIRNMSAAGIRELVNRKSLDHIIIPTLDGANCEKPVEEFYKLPSFHANRSGKCWKVSYSPKEKGYYLVPTDDDDSN
jgi:hypothetical protein